MKAVSALSFLLLSAAMALGQTPRTPNLQLWVPNSGQAAWGGMLNQNFETIDTVLGAFLNGQFIDINKIVFTSGGSIADDANHSPGGLFLTNANNADYLWSYANSGSPGDFDFMQMAAYSPVNGQGAAISVLDGNLGSGRGHMACPGGHVLANGGWTITSNLNTNTQFANACGDVTGEWFNGPLTITWAPLPTLSNPVLVIMPATFAALNGSNPCNSGNQGARASVNDSNTNVNGAVISGGGGNPVAAYCNGTNWIVTSGVLSSTPTNCAAIGSAANPSVAACSAAVAGSVSCATNASTGTCTVNTTAVTANSEILLEQRTDTVTGTRLGVTCNTTKDSNSTAPQITSSVAGTSFTFQLGTVTTNPECFSYVVIN